MASRARITFSRASLRKLRLKSTFEKLGQLIVDGMRKAILAKRNISGGKVEENEEKTRDRKGFDHRMKHTGAFIRHGHVYFANDQSLTVTLRDSEHPNGNGATYLEIGTWNQQGHVKRSTKIPKASDHFGMSDKTEQKVMDELSREIVKQLQKKVTYKAVIDQVV